MTQEFKVGDKVRVVKTIYTDVFYGYLVGDIFKVKKVGVDYIDTVDGPRLWYKEVEKVSNKSQRITDAELAIKAMQYEIAELKFEVAELKQAQKPSGNLSGEYAIPHKGEEVLRGNFKTQNEQRKRVIAEAKAFVAEYSGIIPDESTTLTTEIGDTIVKLHVNKVKRVVTAVPYMVHVGCDCGPSRIKIAKCAPDDVFNADIGKAIALGRALGLDVSKFEYAANPTAPRKGTVVQLLSGELHRLETNHKALPTGFSIVDDTDAKY